MLFSISLLNKNLENILIFSFIYVFDIKGTKMNSSHAQCKVRGEKKEEKKRRKV